MKQSWFFQKFSKINKVLAGVIKKKKEQRNDISYEIEDIGTDSTDMGEIEEQRALPSTFNKASITQISKPDGQSTQIRKLQTNTLHEYGHKNPQQTINIIPQYIKRIIQNDYIKIIPGIKGWLNKKRNLSIV